MKKQENLKLMIINTYYELRKKGVSHSLAFAVCIDMAIAGSVASDDASNDADKQDELAGDGGKQGGS